MARWLVTQGDRQFSAQDLNELKRLAAEGTLGPGDMVQPPGASDWLYATELPELKGLFKNARARDDDDDLAPRRSIPQGPLIAVLLVVLLGVGYGMYYYGVRVPSQQDLTFDLGLQELQITSEAAVLRSGPDASAGTVTSLPKDARVQLVAKRGDFYHVRGDGGSPEGWVHINDVVAGYQFKDARTRDDYDPIYNPDRYVSVQDSSWMEPIPAEGAQGTESITIFQFLLRNRSKFEMTDIVLLATIKDDNDRVLEEKEIAIEGNIPPFASVMIGTLGPPEDAPDGESRQMTDQLFNELAKSDPDLTMRWSAGVEVQMSTSRYKHAEINLLELRAIPRKIE